jgi:hypothetical protein
VLLSGFVGSFLSCLLLIGQGSLLIFNALTLLIQRWPRDKFAWIGIYTRLFFGCALVALIALWSNFDVGGSYLQSGTMLPTLVLVIVFISISPLDDLAVLILLVGVDFAVNLRVLKKYRKAGKYE